MTIFFRVIRAVRNILIGLFIAFIHWVLILNEMSLGEAIGFNLAISIALIPVLWGLLTACCNSPMLKE